MWLVESTDTEESRIQRAECARGWCPSPPVVQEFTVLTESLVYVGYFACITSFSHHKNYHYSYFSNEKTEALGD